MHCIVLWDIITWAWQIDSRRGAITYVNVFTMFYIIGIWFEKENKFESKTLLMMGLTSTIGMSQKALKDTFGRNWSPTRTVRV